MSDSRLGAAVELPWWIIPLGLPPAAVAIAGLILSAPVWAHLLAVASSLTLLIALATIATRVASRSMQSVWISAAYAVWVFTAITWAVIVVATTPPATAHKNAHPKCADCARQALRATTPLQVTAMARIDQKKKHLRTHKAAWLPSA